MVTVGELMSLKPISDFKLITSEKGLGKPVLDTGILEYESNEKIAETFKNGDFVITTLFLAKDNPNQAEECLKMLINQGVSAIAVKNVYFNDFSVALKDYAEEHNCPVFIFSDIFFDDIIVTVKNAIDYFNSKEYYEKKIESIISCDTERNLVLRTAYEINASFYNNVVSAYCVRKKKDSEEMNKPEESTANSFAEAHTATTVLQYKKGLLVLHTMDHLKPLALDSLYDYLTHNEISRSQYNIGVSNIHTDLCDLDFCIKESICAYITCRKESIPIKTFNDTGVDQVLLPLIDSYWMRKYYSLYIKQILDYDKTHGTNLMDTLIHYVESNGEIVQTAKKTFQHANTVRYKLEKVKKLLKLENSDSFYVQLYIAVRLYLLKEFSEETLDMPDKDY